MRGKRKKQYDDEALVQAIAASDKTYTQIARELGVNVSWVWAIARGKARPELTERIRAAAAPGKEPRSRKKGKYDDGALVAAIGAGGTSYAEIGRQFGLGRRTVSDIARGVLRPDLRERIEAARQKGEPMRSHKHREYDDDALVEAIARGDKSYSQMARELGLSASTIAQVCRGTRRPDLQPKIRLATQAFLAEARRLAAGCARHVMARHIKEGLEGSGETARKCREYLLNHCLGDPSRPQTLINQQQSQEHRGWPINPEHAAEFYRWRAQKAGWTDQDNDG